MRAGAKTSAAFDELSMLLGFLRVWGIEKVVNIDALMSPTEEYFNAIYFQVVLSLEINMLCIMCFLSFPSPSNSKLSFHYIYMCCDIVISPLESFHLNSVAVVHLE